MASNSHVVGQRVEMRETRMGHRALQPTGPAHAVPAGQGVRALCGAESVQVADERRTFPPSGLGAPPVCPACKALHEDRAGIE